MTPEPLLKIRGLHCAFDTPGGRVRAVDGVDLDIHAGEVLGLVGESGSGKSTLGRVICGLNDYQGGELHFAGERLPQRFRGADFRRHARRVQMVFQDSYSALNPRLSVLESLEEPLRLRGRREAERRALASDWLSRVGLSPGLASRYPHELSGGQRQRVGIARAFISEPQLVICDEPVSALDVSVQAQIIQLLRTLQREKNTAMLFIAHDLAVVSYLADRVAVMYHGAVVEEGEGRSVFAAPRHPYTRALLRANPLADPRRERARVAALDGGTLSTTDAAAEGCCYAARCERAREHCREEAPRLAGDSAGHKAACHYPLETGEGVISPRSGDR